VDSNNLIVFNYWGRSSACETLDEFIENLDTLKILDLCRMFIKNSRVKEELFYKKPQNNAISLLERLREKLQLANHISEVTKIIKQVKGY
jgi:hypothetical protein